jgi:uncharacterized protein YhbP (UPF0306 family)
MNIEQAIRNYIPDVIHMSLATTSGNKPWVCELHFAFDDGLNLYFRSRASRRHSKEITLNAFVSGNIVKQYGPDDEPVGVYFEGAAKLLPAGDEQNDAFNALCARFGADDKILEEAKDPEGHQFYKISVDTYYLFGTLDERGPKKHEIKWYGANSQ